MRTRRTAFSALTTASLLVGIAGCAAFNAQHDSLIRIKSNRNPAKAQRLTLAGVNALENGKPEYAEEKLLSAIRADPKYGPAHNNIGLLRFDDGKLYQAVLSFERARELMPSDPAVHYNLGLALEKAGRKNRALDLYWQAVELDPTEPRFLGNLVRLRRRLGETGPDVIAQLQDLMLIETRPDWRDWASEQLKVALNPHLDRGPETPEFNGGESTNEPTGNNRPSEPHTRIIDLSPDAKTTGPNQPDKPTEQSPMSQELLPPETSGNLIPKRHLPDDHMKNRDELDHESTSFSSSIPIRSEGAFNTLPQSISESTDATSAALPDNEGHSVLSQPTE
ncbi:MAG TPA: hypothetical protein DEF45_13995 [Rhodopirellula sp.]|nr:hypothetical protein [Rhodopirellula sp.]